MFEVGTQLHRRFTGCLTLLRTLLVMAFALGTGASPHAFATDLTDAVASGGAWLQSQLGATGEVRGENGSIALPLQVRAEALTTLVAMGRDVPDALRQAVRPDQSSVTEYLARYLSASDLADPDQPTLRQRLAAAQNPGGGFGATAGYPSNPLDTAWALFAAGSGQDFNAAVAIAWLLADQNVDGSWTLVHDESPVGTTALVIQALQHYRAQPGVSTALARARGWLAKQESTGRGWGRDDLTAHALLALLPAQSDATAYAGSIGLLVTGQYPSGAWLDDPYVTAVVLRALSLAAQPSTNPDQASVQGVVLADSSGQPLFGARVMLQSNARTVTSDENGRFVFFGLTTGSEVLTIQMEGYRVLSASLQLHSGQAIDLGSLRMLASTGVLPSPSPALQSTSMEQSRVRPPTPRSA